jgi:targeting protein for Xklp2
MVLLSDVLVLLVLRGARDAVAGKAAAVANDIAQEHQAVKKQKLDDGRTRQVLYQELILKMELGNSCCCQLMNFCCGQILNVKTRVLPHKGKGGLAGSTEMISLSSMRKHHDGAHSLKV